MGIPSLFPSLSLFSLSLSLFLSLSRYFSSAILFSFLFCQASSSIILQLSFKPQLAFSCFIYYIMNSLSSVSYMFECYTPQINKYGKNCFSISYFLKNFDQFFLSFCTTKKSPVLMSREPKSIRHLFFHTHMRATDQMGV